VSGPRGGEPVPTGDSVKRQSKYTFSTLCAWGMGTLRKLLTGPGARQQVESVDQ